MEHMNNSKIAIKGGTLIDGTGESAIDNAIVLIESTKITSVGKENQVQIPNGTKVINAEGKTIMPGLMDLHVHLGAVRNPERPNVWFDTLRAPRTLRVLFGAKEVRDYIDAGFTTIRNFQFKEFIQLKKAINLGIICGPRIVHGGLIAMTGGHLSGAVHADGDVEVRKAVREQCKEGADVIKTATSGGAGRDYEEVWWRNYTLEEISAMVDEAHALGKKVAAHAAGNQGIKNAINAGVDTIEHGIYLDDEAIEMMINSNVIFVPTLAIYGPRGTQSPLKPWVPSWVRSKSVKIHKDHIPSFKKAYKAGVKIAMGTDTGKTLIHGENAYELELYVKYGMSEMEAIVASTKICAEALGMENKIGTIQEGKLADIIIVDGNPLKDIKILQKKNLIKMVIKEGEIVKNK
jgi:imidazolonepropionase-like amidohydrolase